jgi:mono/diheme cytochrome c family protein
MGKTLHARDLTSDEVQKQSDAELAEVITKGKNKMPAYGEKLSKVQIAELVAYIRELAKKNS